MATLAEPIAPMPEGDRATPIAIVGLACRFPDADDPLTLFESALAGRRSFRRLPPGRASAPTGGQLSRAAVLEGWQFSRAEFGVTEAAYRSADPAHWLALETAGRALADAGFPGGQGVARDRAGVIIGNTLTGELSRAAALHAQWPYVASVLAGALAAGEVPPAGPAQSAPARRPGRSPRRSRSLARTRWRAASPGPSRTGSAITSASAAAVTRWIPRTPPRCSRWLPAARSWPRANSTSCWPAGWTSAWTCSSWAGWPGPASWPPGRCASMTPAPTGFLPGEGCGIIALMRAADARAADMPSYADIVGWGISSAGPRDGQQAGQLLALQRAYQRAGVQPGDIQFIEGDGRGTADGDLAELAALTTIRAGAVGRRGARLGEGQHRARQGRGGRGRADQDGTRG